jgi:transmembrane 9 superfamily member 2/4
MVNALTSTRTLLPMDNYEVPFCQPAAGGDKEYEMNLGQLLAGDRIQPSPYLLMMKKDMYCEQLCVAMLGRAEPNGVTPTVKAIREGYHSNWIVDNLASAGKLEDDRMVVTRYWLGFPVGFVNESDSKAYIYNHVNIEIQYHTNHMEKDKFQIVRFVVEPFSIKHDITPLTTPEEPDGERFYLPRHYKIKKPISSCDPGIVDRQHTNYNMIVDGKPQEASGDVLFTYDVVWTENREVHWASRWDIYVTMDNAIPVHVHWVSIAYSLIYALALSGLVAVILARNVQRANNDDNDDEEGQGDDATEQVQESLSDKGYTLVYVDYFHPPDNRLFLLAVFCGTGAQVLACFMITTIAAAFGFLHSSQRGLLIVVALFAFYACGAFNGFVTVQVLKVFKAGQDWQWAGLVSSIFFPGITLALFLGQEIIAHAGHSTLAVPLRVILVLLALWLGVSVPLTYLGAYAGNCVDIRSASLPTTPRTIWLGVASYQSIRNGDRLTKCLCVTFCLVFNVRWLAIGFLWLVRHCMVKL